MSQTAIIEQEISRLMQKRNRTAEAERLASLTGQLMSKTEEQHGKTYTRFYGDAAACWAPFQPPMRNRITGFNKRPDR